jgi:hypothetical protein
MTRIERIEKEVAELTPAELEEFRRWFDAFSARRWDNAFERDAESGALEAAADAALAEHRAGRTGAL